MKLRSAKKITPEKAEGATKKGRKKATKKTREGEDRKEGEEPLFFISTEPDEVESHAGAEDEGGENDVSKTPSAPDDFYVSTEPDPVEVGSDDEGERTRGTEEVVVEASSDDDDVQEEEEEDEQPWSIPMKDSKENEKRSAGREKMLQRMLFGSALKEDVAEIKEVSEDEEDEEEREGEHGDDEVRRLSDKEGAEGGEVEKPKKKKKKKRAKAKRTAVWRDEDDEGTLVKDVTATYTRAPGKHGAKETSEEKYSKALKRKFLSLVGTPAWADLDRSEKKRKGGDEEEDEKFFRETTDMLDAEKHAELTRERLLYRKVKDLNDETHAEGAVIRAAEFHPSAAVALVAGLNGTASLFQVDGRMNPKIQSVNFSDFPIKTAHFSHDGSEFICGSQQASYLHLYDLGKAKATRVDVGGSLDKQGALQWFEVSPAGDFLAVLGRFGHIHFLSSKTKEKIFSLKMNDDVTCVAFAPGGRELYSHGSGGEVYLWDVRQTRSCTHRFADDGCVRGTALAISPDGRHIAAGAASGVVNLYDAREARTSRQPAPSKAVMNLTTPVAKLRFNPSSEILAMTSEVKDNAIKLLHVSSKTVYANFPSWNFNLRRVNCVDFSLNGGFMSVGNNRGAANLFRISHYGSF